MIDLENSYFLIHFACKLDYDHVLNSGFLLVFSHYVMLRKWRPNFDPDSKIIDHAVVWVRVPNLSIECYSKVFLWRLGHRIDNAVKIDGTTLGAMRGKYARLCVEVDLKKSLLFKF